MEWSDFQPKLFYVLCLFLLLVIPEHRSTSALKSDKSKSSQERLRERLTEFMVESSKQLSFDVNASSSAHVTAIADRDAFVTCAVTKPLRRHKLSFFRLKDYSLLFVGRHPHITDKRFSVLVSDNRRKWTLKLQSIKPQDGGLYECQVNTRPTPIGLVINVTVVSGRASIYPDDPVIYLNVGGQLSLRCVIETGPVAPQFILWYRDDRLVEYSQGVDAVVSIQSNGSAHTSHLEVRNVSVADTGQYRCGSDLTSEAAVQVYVVEEDFKSLSLGSHEEAVRKDSGMSLNAVSNSIPVAATETDDVGRTVSSSSGITTTSSWLLVLLYSIMLTPSCS